MKKVLVISRQDDRETYDTQENMLRGLRGIGSKAHFDGAMLENLLFDFDGTELRITDLVSGINVADYDAIFFFGWFKKKTMEDVVRAVSHYAKLKGIPFVNSEAYYARSTTKLSQCVMAALNGVTVTPFLFAMNQELLVKVAQERNLSMPYIAKAVSASRGRDNYLIKDHDELVRAVAEDSEDGIPRYFILQEFVPNDGDYRILVMGDKARLIIHRQAQDGSHLNNTSQGGKATLTDLAELPEETLRQAAVMARVLHREITGVDMIRHQETGVFYFLEANNMPQLATGSFISEKLAQVDAYLDELQSGTAHLYID